VTRRAIDHRYAPPARHTAVCRAGDPHKTVVDETGALRDRPEPDRMSLSTYRYRRSIGFTVRRATPLQVTGQWTPDPRVPIVVTELAGDGLTLRLQAAGHRHADGRRTDVVRWTITVTAVDGADAAFVVVYREPGMRAQPAGLAASRRCYVVPDEPGGTSLDLDVHFRSHDDPVPGDEPPVLISDPHPLTLLSAWPADTMPVLCTAWQHLARGEVMEGTVFVPRGHGDVAGLDHDAAAGMMAAERRFWTGHGNTPVAGLQIPDQGVSNLLAASARTIAQMREDRDGRRRFQVGPSVYRGVWIVDGYFLLEAARYLGDDRAARDGLEDLLGHASDDGAIQILDGHSKETAVALACVMRQAELDGVGGLPDTRWGLVERGLDHIASLRRAALDLPADHPMHGLLPAAMADGGLGGVRAEYTSTLWTLSGLQAVARTAGPLGRPDVARRATVLRDGLAEAFEAHAARDAVARDDGSLLLAMAKSGGSHHNLIPEFHDEPPPERRIRPATATWALAHAVHPGEVLAVEHPVVVGLCGLLEELDTAQGLPEGTGWLPHRAVWTYAAVFYAHVWLCAGQPAKAVDYLYAFADHATPTGVWREEQSLTDSGRGEYLGDMPHAWASAEFIRLVRHLIVFERDTRLHLAAGLPAEWLDTGRPVAVRHTPTRFGRVSLSVQRDDVVLVTMTRTEGLCRPGALLLHLDMLPERPDVVEIDGRAVAVPPAGPLPLPDAPAVTVRIKTR
jgi:hypothetical protein